MIVPESRYEEAVAIAKKVFESVTVTNAMGGNMGDIGPLASQMQFDKVTGYIQKGIDEGARLVTGGPGRPVGFDQGYFVQPTVFADVNNQMTIAREEIFGPVLSIIPYKTEAEAIEIANDTIYGLNNGVNTNKERRAVQSVFILSFNVPFSLPPSLKITPKTNTYLFLLTSSFLPSIYIVIKTLFFILLGCIG